jgi:hypothetical protein
MNAFSAQSLVMDYPAWYMNEMGYLNEENIYNSPIEEKWR